MRRGKASKFSPPEFGSEIPFYARPFLRCFGKIVMKRAKKSVWEKHRKNIEALEVTLDTLTENRIKAEKLNLTAAVEVYRISEFILICQADISILGHDVLLAESGWRQNLYARVLALTLVETIEDLTQILGKTFKLRLHEAFKNDALDAKLRVLTKNVTQFRGKHEKFLRDIRDHVAAHKDHDPALLLHYINNLDSDAILTVATDFRTHSEAILSFIRDDLLLKIDRQWVVQQFLKSPKS